MLTVDLEDPLLLSAARELAPFYLRLGGSLSDSVTYEEADGCVPVDASNATTRSCGAACVDQGFVHDDRLRVGFRGGCLSQARWRQLSSFCERAGCEMVLSINAMRGRVRASVADCDGVDCRNTRPAPACCFEYAGEWDGSNALAFLTEAARRGDPLAAVAFGNELGGRMAIGARLSPTEYARGLAQLRSVVDRAWKDAAGGSSATRRPPPRVIGPNSQLDGEWFGALARADPALQVVTHHMYPLGAGSMTEKEMISKILRPGFLDKIKQRGDDARSAVRGASKAGEAAAREMWVTEIGGAYNSGRPGVTDRFVSVFWWADALGSLALKGTSVVCRQTLLGGNYGLLALGPKAGGFQSAVDAAAEPPPRGPSADWYVSVLWKRLMGRRVLPLHLASSEQQGNASETGEQQPPRVRAYASCAADGARTAPGAVSLLLLNMHKSAAAEVDVAALLTPFRRRPTMETFLVGGCAGEQLAPPITLRPAIAAGLAPTNATVLPSVAPPPPPLSWSPAEPWDECQARCAQLPACAEFAVATVAAAEDGDSMLRECTLHADGGAAAAADDDGAADDDAFVGCFARGGRAGSSATRHVWRLTAPSLSATGAEVLLNGQPLRAEARARGELPELPPSVDDAGLALEAPPLSLAFVVFPEARWLACL